MSKRQNNITWQRFKAALNGSGDRTEKRVFGMFNGQEATCEQRALIMTNADHGCCRTRVHTEPIEFHMT